MAVRYDTKFMNEIMQVVNKYNRKITRLSKKGVTSLPYKFTRESLKSLKQTAASRTEVRRRLKDLQSFTQKGGEKLVNVGKASIPKYQLSNIKRYQRLLKTQTTRKLKELTTRHPVTNGVEDPYTFSQYGSQEYLSTKAKRINLLNKDLSKMDSREISKYLEKLKANTKERNLEIWQDNYLSILEDTALSYGYDADKLEYIISRLSKLSANDFDDLSFINRNIKEIIYYYKVLEDIQTANELTEVGGDVVRNLDAIYDNLDDILAEYE